MPRRTFHQRMTKEKKALKFGVNTTPLEKLQAYMRLNTEMKVKKACVDFFLAADSSVEQRWSKIGRGYVEQMRGESVIFSAYHWFTFILPGSKYTADWYYLMEGGAWVIVEVKASKMQDNYRDARSKLRQAATFNPWFDFYEAMPDRKEGIGGWHFEYIEPDLDFLSTFSEVMGAWTNELLVPQPLFLGDEE